MNEERSKYHEWKNYEEATKLTKKMNALLSFWDEEKRYQETLASDTSNSLKRLRSLEDGRETDQDHSVNKAKTDMNDAEAGANPSSTFFKRIKRPNRPQAIWHR